MNALRSEARKAVTTPTTWWLLLAAIALVAAGSYLSIALSDVEGPALLTENSIRIALHGAAGGSVLMAVAGALTVSGEWRTGQAAQTFLSTPRRGRVLLAKSIVYIGIGLGYGLVASAVTLPVVWLLYRTEGLAFPLDDPLVRTSLLGVVLAAVLLGLLGIGVGAVMRNPVLSTTATLGWFFLFEPIVAGAIPAVGKWLPGIAATALSGYPGEDQLSAGVAAAAIGLTAVGVLALGAMSVRRAEVVG